MRRLIPLLLIAPWLCQPARAQVTVDLRALDSLPSRPPAAHAPKRPAHKPAPAARARPDRTTPATATSSHRAAPAPAPVPAPAGPAGPPAGVAGSAPPAPGSAAGGGATAAASVPSTSPAPSAPGPSALAPSAPAAAPPPAGPSAPPSAPPSGPAAPSAPPPPPPAALAGPSPGAAVALPAPLTLSFPAGKATLTPAETEAIARLVRAAPQTNSTSFSVLAYAAGSPQNPSAARRLALARALAVHDALRAAGVPGSRIFLRAMGPPDGSGAPDRAELRVSAAAGTKS